MKKKRVCYTELAYVLGIVILAIGTAFMERADFGLSMVVAPAYLLHLKIQTFLPFYTFGMSEYVFQAALLAAMCIALRRFKKSYLFSFVTAVIYGFLLDFSMWAVAFLPEPGMAGRIVFFAVGLILCAAAIAFIFRTYISPEVYELFVKEVSEKTGKEISKVKMTYDWCSCAAAVVLSFAFFGFGQFKGIWIGTFVCALVNGWLIGRIGRWLDSVFEFRDAFRLRGLFEK